jgi:hypothetical protein
LGHPFPLQKLGKKKNESANIVKAEDKDEIFAFVCSSNLKAFAVNLKVDVSKTDAIIDSDTSRHCYPGKSKSITISLLII